jgi:hypothetical protein
MNTLVLLMATTLTPGGDPVQVVQYSGAPMSSYSYADNGSAGQPEGRRWFPRLRAMFSRRSQSSDQVPTDAAPAYPRASFGAGAISGPVSAPVSEPVLNPTPVASPRYSSVPVGPSINTPSVTPVPTGATPPQRMPTGNPF